MPPAISTQEGSDMWGFIAKLTILPGRRDEMAGILTSSTTNAPGCLIYIVSKDSADENVLWVTEVWDSLASHDASLSLPAVKNAISRGKPLISNFEKIAVTTPVGGVGLPATHHR
jgi:quinol monooxygenase YgiN